MDIAGRHITEYLVRLLQKKGYSFNSSADFEFVRELKEKLGELEKFAKMCTFSAKKFNLFKNICIV